MLISDLKIISLFSIDGAQQLSLNLVSVFPVARSLLELVFARGGWFVNVVGSPGTWSMEVDKPLPLLSMLLVYCFT